MKRALMERRFFIMTSKQVKISAYNNEHKRFTLKFEPGKFLLEAVNDPLAEPKRQGIPFICKNGACRSCVIEVLEGKDLLTPPSRLEQRALQVGKTTIEKGFRLACLTQFKDHS
jgi:ferredoxin